MAPGRSLWRGSLSFGLVNVPVALVSGVRDRDVHFHQLDRETGERLHVERFCKLEDRPIPYEEIVSGYEVEPDRWVTVTDGELEAAQPEKTRTIEIAQFADVAEIDPVLLDHPYWLVPNGEGEGPLRAYRLLVEVMAREERAAIGHLVLRTKEHLVALRAREGLLQLLTMRFAAEVRDPGELPGVAESAQAEHEPSPEELDHASRLVEQLATDWDPARCAVDPHRERLLALVERKRAGEEILTAPEPEAPAAVPDLMAALRASLEAAEAG